MFEELLFACHATNTLWANVAKRVRARRHPHAGSSQPRQPLASLALEEPGGFLGSQASAGAALLGHYSGHTCPRGHTTHGQALRELPHTSRGSIHGPGAPSGRLGALAPATPGQLPTTSWGAAFHLPENRPHLERPLSPRPAPGVHSGEGHLVLLQQASQQYRKLSSGS